MSQAATRLEATGPVRGRIAYALALAAGLALFVAALLAEPDWFDRHFVRAFFIPRQAFLAFETCARVCVGAAGALLVLRLAPAIGRAVARASPGGLLAGTARIAVSLVLALAIGELGLRAAFSRAAEQGGARAEPLRRPDPRLGWVFQPSRASRVTAGGRSIDYAFDARGYRVPSLRQPVDPAQPSVIFAGESIFTGFGLSWDQTIPARVGAAMGLQSANLGVFGYADDQTHLRLAAELPRFARPRAVVILYSPGLFFRDLDDDRPHLGPGLTLLPPVQRWRIESLTRLFMAYHSQRELEAAAAVVRAELTDDVAMARARGAQALIVVPSFGPEDPVERRLRTEVLDQPGLPYVQVPLDKAWRLPGDLHPDARGARVLADAIVSRLRITPLVQPDQRREQDQALLPPVG